MQSVEVVRQVNTKLPGISMGQICGVSLIQNGESQIFGDNTVNLKITVSDYPLVSQLNPFMCLTTFVSRMNCVFYELRYIS